MFLFQLKSRVQKPRETQYLAVVMVFIHSIFSQCVNNEE